MKNLSEQEIEEIYRYYEEKGIDVVDRYMRWGMLPPELEYDCLTCLDTGEVLSGEPRGYPFDPCHNCGGGCVEKTSNE